MANFKNRGNGRTPHPVEPTHVPGVHMGGRVGSMRREPGIDARGPSEAVGTARRSTGINAGDRNPINPRSPNLSPA
ncbi:hypothetical protein [Vulgatibacter incomptus]|uniref:Uncharacterized protein n=1 Tax=Vulgatibacter incomptus TaxID=1391653 RepID=A0A0K1PAJ9_9BACT|nr:hypothetical protein [Vulgatibacter incomptus]AKU90139.1 hypothetical protein AKJ08_0526 [Vulgatibacter incomptus]